MEKKGRRLFSTNEYERKILKGVFLASSIPVILVAAFFYFVFNDLVHNHLRTNMANQLLQQLTVLLVIALVYYFLFVGILAYRFTHKLVGAFPRVLKEMDKRIAGETKAHITIRRGDYIKGFVDRVNAILDKLP